MLGFIADVVVCSITLDAVDAAVLPRKAPYKMEPMQGDVLASPTPLPIVSTYTLYFGNGGSTTTAPVASQTAALSTFSTLASSSAPSPSRSSSSAGHCSKKKHASASSSGNVVST